MVSNIEMTKEMRGTKLNLQYFIGFENFGFLVFGLPVGFKVVIFRGFSAQLRKRKYRNGAKHSPPSLGAEVAQRAKNQGFEIKRANSISFFLMNYKVLALSPGLFTHF